MMRTDRDAAGDAWVFEVKQGGRVVVTGDAPDRDTALREAAHYTAMYGQDGKVETIVRRVTPDERDGDQQ